MVSKRRLIYWTPAAGELRFDNFGDTLRDGSRLASLMEHLLLNYVKHSV